MGIFNFTDTKKKTKPRFDFGKPEEADLKGNVQSLLTEEFSSSAVVSGIMGNIHQETGGSFDFEQEQFGGGPGKGLFQFEGIFKKGFDSFLEKNELEDSAESQVKFMSSVLKSDEDYDIGAGNRSKVKKAFESGDVDLITEEFSNRVLRPGKPQLDKRKKFSQEVFDVLNIFRVKEAEPAETRFDFGEPLQGDPNIPDLQPSAEPKFVENSGPIAVENELGRHLERKVQNLLTDDYVGGAIDIITGGMTLQEAEQHRDMTVEKAKRIPGSLVDLVRFAGETLSNDLKTAQRFIQDPIKALTTEPIPEKTIEPGQALEGFSNIIEFIFNPYIKKARAIGGFVFPEDEGTLKTRLTQAVKDVIKEPGIGVISQRIGEDVFTGEEETIERIAKIGGVGIVGTIAEVLTFNPRGVFNRIKKFPTDQKIARMNEIIAEVDKDLPALKTMLRKVRPDLPPHVVDGLGSRDFIIGAQTNPQLGNYLKAVTDRVAPRFTPRRILRSERGGFKLGSHEDPNFQNWFKGSKVKDPITNLPKVLYSGHANTSLYKDFDPKKATAGGFYATANPEIASNYALGKFGVKESFEYGSQYVMKGKGGKYNKKLHQIELTDAQKKMIDEMEGKFDDDEIIRGLGDYKRWIEQNKKFDKDANRASYRPYALENIYKYMESMGHTIAYPDRHEYKTPKGEVLPIDADEYVYIKTGRKTPYSKLKDLPEYETLTKEFDDKFKTAERRPYFELQQKNDFEELLDHLGIDWQSQETAQPGVFPIYLNIQNPIVVSQEFPKDAMNVLKHAAKREKVKDYEGDQWTQDYPLKNWIKDIEEGSEFWATQIPKKARTILKEMGYDGIHDIGGKGGGEKHDVWIAFDKEQIRSALTQGTELAPEKPVVARTPTEKAGVEGKVYHGTSIGSALRIQKEGLSLQSVAKGVEQVSLSEDEAYARTYAERKSPGREVMLRVNRTGDMSVDERIVKTKKGKQDIKSLKAILPEAIEVKTKEGNWIPISEYDFIEQKPIAQQGKGEIEKPIEEPKPISEETRISNLKKDLSDISTTFRRQETITKKQIKAVQEEVIRTVKEGDVGKFIKTVKNIQTPEQFQRALPEIVARVNRQIESAGKNVAEESIKKELKRTKPLKVGAKRVGKFDYENNKLFEDLRKFNTMTKGSAQEALDLLPDEGTEADLIKKRMLSLKANGRSASLEIFNQVLADIKRMKTAGAEAKSEEDFAKRIERQERIDEALDKIGKIKADKNTVKTQIGNAYRKGFTNIWSMLNSIGGKEFANKYDPILKQNEMVTKIYFRTKEASIESAKIYEVEDIFPVLENLTSEKFEIIDFEGLKFELDKLDLIDIHNSIKNEHTKKRYHEVFGKDQIDRLLTNLTHKDVNFADYLQETVQEYREIHNQRSIETIGRDLGFVENYWPRTSERVLDVFDDIRIQGETPSAQQARSKGAIIPVPGNAWLKFQKHLAQGEHVDNLSREFERMKKLFSDRKVKNAIINKFGEDVYKVLNNQIDDISLNAHSQKIDAVSGLFKIAINNWVTAKIALNPSTWVRQLISVGNYAENIPVTKWTEGFAEGLSDPTKTFNFMWNNAPFLEARFNRGYSEALEDALEGAKAINVNWGNWSKFLASLARSGDITAIIYGGKPFVDFKISEGKAKGLSESEATKQAFKLFEAESLTAQQSGLSSSRSQFQNSKNPFARLFLAFKNTSNQYFRKMVDAVISFQNGDISAEQFAKTMAIYAVIQPTLYASSGILVKQFFQFIGGLIGVGAGIDKAEEIGEKLAFEIMNQIVVSPVNAVPVLDDIVRFATRKATGQKIWKIFNTPLFDDIETGLRKLTKKNPTAKDYLIAASSVLEPATMTPVRTYIRLFDLVTKGEAKIATEEAKGDARQRRERVTREPRQKRERRKRVRRFNF